MKALIAPDAGGLGAIRTEDLLGEGAGLNGSGRWIHAGVGALIASAMGLLGGCGGGPVAALPSVHGAVPHVAAGSTRPGTHAVEIRPAVVPSVRQIRSKRPPYTATLHLPRLTWVGHAGIAGRINATVQTWAARETTHFAAGVTRDLAGAQHIPASLPPSTLTITYQVVNTTSSVVSYRFLIEPFFRGAASPAQTPAGLTFSLATGTQYRLAKLFRSGTPYRAAIATQAGKGLAGFSPAGARCYLGKKPTVAASAAAAWWLSPHGLVLSFPAGAYTVAACGPPTVTIPYLALRGMAATGSPLRVG